MGSRSVIRTIFLIASVCVATLLGFTPASADSVSRSAEFDVPANSSGFATVSVETGEVACELTVTVTFRGETTTKKSNGEVTEFEFRFEYESGDSPEILRISATCVFDDLYADPALIINDPNLGTGGDLKGDGGGLPGTGGMRLWLLLAGVAAVAGGAFGAYRWRSI